MKTKKVYIYRYTTRPCLVKVYNGNFTIIEKNGEIGFDNYVDVEDFDYVNIEYFDNLDNLVNESFNDEGLCYDFYSFRNDRMEEFKDAISKIIQEKIDYLEDKIKELEYFKNNIDNDVSNIIETAVKLCKEEKN